MKPTRSWEVGLENDLVLSIVSFAITSAHAIVSAREQDRNTASPKLSEGVAHAPIFRVS